MDKWSIMKRRRDNRHGSATSGPSFQMGAAPKKRYAAVAAAAANHKPPAPAMEWAKVVTALAPGWRTLDRGDVQDRPDDWTFFGMAREVLMDLEQVTSHMRCALSIVAEASGRLLNTQEHLQVGVVCAYIIDVIEMYNHHGYPDNTRAAEFTETLSEICAASSGELQFGPVTTEVPLKGALSNLIAKVKAAKEGEVLYYHLEDGDNEGYIDALGQATEELRNLASAKYIGIHYPFSFVCPATNGQLFGSLGPETKIGRKNVPLTTYVNGTFLTLIARRREVFVFESARLTGLGVAPLGPWRGLASAAHVLMQRLRTSKEAINVQQAREMLRPAPPAVAKTPRSGNREALAKMLSKARSSDQVPIVLNINMPTDPNNKVNEEPNDDDEVDLNEVEKIINSPEILDAILGPANKA